MEGCVFSLPSGPALCGRPGDAASCYHRSDVVLGCTVGCSCAAHEQGEGLAVSGSLQKALHCLWGPGTTPASTLHHGSAGLLHLGAFAPLPGHAPTCLHLVPFVMALWVMAPSVVVPWVIALFVVVPPVVVLFIVALVCAPQHSFGTMRNPLWTPWWSPSLPGGIYTFDQWLSCFPCCHGDSTIAVSVPPAGMSCPLHFFLWCCFCSNGVL